MLVNLINAASIANSLTSIALPMVACEFCVSREVPHILYTKIAPTARRILVIGENRTFATISAQALRRPARPTRACASVNARQFHWLSERWTGKRNGYGMWVITSTEERWRDLVSAEWGNTRSDKEAVSTSVEEFRDTPCAIDVWLC